MTDPHDTQRRIRPVVLAGGSGTRLWPVSRASFPKQFTTLLGEETLFQAAVQRFDKLLGDMDDCLAQSPWLAGDDFSLADIAYTPYAVRLDHLQLQGMWDRRPHVAGWYDRLTGRPSFKAAPNR